MTPSQHDYYRDAIVMAALEGVPLQSLEIAEDVAENGLEWNAAIWAAVRLSEVCAANKTWQDENGSRG